MRLVKAVCAMLFHVVTTNNDMYLQDRADVNYLVHTY